jgi:hypothetical protein
LIGLNFALTDWLFLLLGTVLGFFVKIILIIVGLVITVVANSQDSEEKYDEYFDGDAYN